jgi:CoA-transferase family III
MKRLPLENLRVVECGDGVAAAFATKLLALLGAHVVKIEPPEGDSTRFRGPFFGEHADPDLTSGSPRIERSWMTSSRSPTFWFTASPHASGRRSEWAVHLFMLTIRA